MNHQVRTLDDAETFHEMGKSNKNTGWGWNIPWDGHSEHWMGLEHSMGWTFRTLDGAGTFHGMGIPNTGWGWNILWDGHSEHWMVLEHSMGWAFKTLDGAGIFHGMGIIGAATPGTKHRKTIRREVTETLELPSSICHWPTRRCCRTSLLKTKARYSAFLGRYPGPYPGSSRMLQSVCDGIYPGQSTFLSYP